MAKGTKNSESSAAVVLAVIAAGVLLVLPLLAADASRSARTAEKVTPTATPNRQSLSELAKGITLNRDGVKQGKDGLVVSDSDLGDLAEKGTLANEDDVAKSQSVQAQTKQRRYVGGGAGAQSPAETRSDPVQAPNTEAKRAHWRSVYKKQLAKIEGLKVRREFLDSEIPALWNEFYRTDNPGRRDGVIKPKLDKLVVERQGLDAKITQAEEDLVKIKRDARRDGALPGWFRNLDRK